MKKFIFIAILMIFTFGSSAAFADNTGPKSVAPAQTEKKLSAEEISRLTKRINEIRHMDKSKMTAAEKKELKKEVKEIRDTVKKDGVVLYLSGAAIIIIILLLLLLL
ncbi:MAG: hypothetical protein NTU44_04925 [Bacteroidetes bacterium]|nr:hypothetical protein [Bacteroidota bacterium]